MKANMAAGEALILAVFYQSEQVGCIEFVTTHEPVFYYSTHWLSKEQNFPISLSMPLGEIKYQHPLCFNFFDNFLPEGKLRAIFAAAKQSSEQNLYQLLKNLNSDLPGALEFAPLESRKKSQKMQPVDVPRQPLSFKKLNHLLEQESSLYEGLIESEGAEFSIAGMQDKFTCQYEPNSNEIFLVFGRMPSTHIVKVNPKWKNNQIVPNEYFCMNLAKKIGLPVPRMFLENLASKENPILILERFDRAMSESKNNIERIHQEDLCQVFGFHSSTKYEHEGGPSFESIYKRVKNESTKPIQDLGYLLDWLVFNFIIGNNDSHAKNLSVLLNPLPHK